MTTDTNKKNTVIANTLLTFEAKVANGSFLNDILKGSSDLRLSAKARLHKGVVREIKRNLLKDAEGLKKFAKDNDRRRADSPLRISPAEMKNCLAGCNSQTELLGAVVKLFSEKFIKNVKVNLGSSALNSEAIGKGVGIINADFLRVINALPTDIAASKSVLKESNDTLQQALNSIQHLEKESQDAGIHISDAIERVKSNIVSCQMLIKNYEKFSQEDRNEKLRLYRQEAKAFDPDEVPLLQSDMTTITKEVYHKLLNSQKFKSHMERELKSIKFPLDSTDIDRVEKIVHELQQTSMLDLNALQADKIHEFWREVEDKSAIDTNTEYKFISEEVQASQLRKLLQQQDDIDLKKNSVKVSDQTKGYEALSLLQLKREMKSRLETDSLKFKHGEIKLNPETQSVMLTISHIKRPDLLAKVIPAVVLCSAVPVVGAMAAPFVGAGVLAVNKARQVTSDKKVIKRYGDIFEMVDAFMTMIEPMADNNCLIIGPPGSKEALAITEYLNSKAFDTDYTVSIDNAGNKSEAEKYVEDKFMDDAGTLLEREKDMRSRP